MSAIETRVHRRIEQLVNAANDFLPEDVHLGYALCHTHDDEGNQLDDATIMAAEASIKAGMAAELGRRVLKGRAGADEDVAALPGRATSIGEVDVIFDLFHKPSGISVVRTYRLATLVNLATREDWTDQQKRQAVKTQLQSFYSDLQARLPGEQREE